MNSDPNSREDKSAGDDSIPAPAGDGRNYGHTVWNGWFLTDSVDGKKTNRLGLHTTFPLVVPDVLPDRPDGQTRFLDFITNGLNSAYAQDALGYMRDSMDAIYADWTIAPRGLKKFRDLLEYWATILLPPNFGDWNFLAVYLETDMTAGTYELCFEARLVFTVTSSADFEKMRDNVYSSDNTSEYQIAKQNIYNAQLDPHHHPPLNPPPKNPEFAAIYQAAY